MQRINCQIGRCFQIHCDESTPPRAEPYRQLMKQGRMVALRKLLEKAEYFEQSAELPFHSYDRNVRFGSEGVGRMAPLLTDRH